ncbi:hypothetical protein [Bacteroides finegoldii]|uniref:hypothetical protein n=1 Tax=Bacteroides finegoldii TaxID=338188 RepID=UPI0005198221|nr:hypothetical protein [Bacteroides finegoldii]
MRATRGGSRHWQIGPGGLPLRKNAIPHRSHKTNGRNGSYKRDKKKIERENGTPVCRRSTGSAYGINGLAAGNGGAVICQIYIRVYIE